MHLAIKWNVLNNLATIDFERGSKIVDVHAGKLAHHPVGDSRGQAAHYEIVHALLAPAADDVAMTGFKGVEQSGDVGGVVLQVAVHRNDDVAGSEVEPCRQRGRLPVVPF